MKVTPDIADLVPHEPPMRLVERVVDWQGGSLEAVARVRDTSPFVEDGRLEPMALVEYMAQAAAALAGLQDRGGEPAVRSRYLVGLRDATFDGDAIPVGTELVLRARETGRTRELVHFDCEAEALGARVAHAELSVYAGELA